MKKLLVLSALCLTAFGREPKQKETALTVLLSNQFIYRLVGDDRSGLYDWAQPIWKVTIQDVDFTQEVEGWVAKDLTCVLINAELSCKGRLSQTSEPRWGISSCTLFPEGCPTITGSILPATPNCHWDHSEDVGIVTGKITISYRLFYEHKHVATIVKHKDEKLFQLFSADPFGHLNSSWDDLEAAQAEACRVFAKDAVVK